MMSPNDDASSVPSSASAPATAAAAASGPPLAHHLQQPAANPLAPATPATQTTTTSSSPGAADRIRRNTACTNCRDAKVKCSNPGPGQRCVRCLRLRTECVVDRSHKRISRRSKFEELAQEVRSIREAVSSGVAAATSPGRVYPGGQPTPSTGAPAPAAAAAVRQLPLPPPPSLTSHISPRLPPIHDQQQQQQRPLAPSTPTHTVTTAASVSSYSTPAAAAAGAVDQQQRVHHSHSTPAHAPVRPAEARALGSRVFCGEDIDFYFQRYFEHFHPYFPIVRIRDPDTCYRSSPLLFWTVVVVACRRYVAPHDPEGTALQFLVDHLPREVWAVVSATHISPPSVNALILLCAWPLTNIRFLTNPSPIYAGIAMNAALQLGLHTGRGKHRDFWLGPLKYEVSDEEAAYTWAGYNIVAQTTSTITGYPSIGCLFNETVDLMTSDANPFGIPRCFKIQLLCQKFYNRACLSLSACIEDGRGAVPHQLVDNLEREFRMTHQSLLADGEPASDLDSLTLLATLLDLQVYYFLPQADVDAAALRRNCLRAFSTAETVVRTALALQASSAFLSHAPHYVFRTVLTATCIIFKVLRSSYRAYVDPGGETVTAGTPNATASAGRGPGGGRTVADDLTKDCFLALSACSTRDGDLPARAARLFESYWLLRGWLPVQDVPTTNFAGRMGASMTFACLKLWKDDVERAGTTAAAQGMQAMSASASDGAGAGLGTASGAMDGGDGAPQLMSGLPSDPVQSRPMVEPFPGLEWSNFMENFDWTFDPEMLGVAAVG